MNITLECEAAMARIKEHINRCAGQHKRAIAKSFDAVRPKALDWTEFWSDYAAKMLRARRERDDLVIGGVVRMTVFSPYADRGLQNAGMGRDQQGLRNGFTLIDNDGEVL